VKEVDSLDSRQTVLLGHARRDAGKVSTKQYVELPIGGYTTPSRTLAFPSGLRMVAGRSDEAPFGKNDRGEPGPEGRCWVNVILVDEGLTKEVTPMSL
jgi:hypothetical protein